MAKIIAYAPNGQAYQCDSMREAKLVQGGFKFKRKNGCGCGGACGNPHCGPKRKNGTKVPADQHQFARWREKAKHATDAELLYVIRDAQEAARAMRGHDPVAEGWYADEAHTYADELRHRRERAAGKRRNPGATLNEDYNMAVFAGAVEHGKLPAHDASAEYQQGYREGAKIAKENKLAVAAAIGAFRTNKSQAKAGQMLREMSGKSPTSPINNPRKRRNPQRGYVQPVYHGGKKLWALMSVSKGEREREVRRFDSAAEARKALRAFEKSAAPYKISAKVEQLRDYPSYCYPTVLIKKGGKAVDTIGPFESLLNAEAAAHEAVYDRPTCTVEIVCESELASVTYKAATRRKRHNPDPRYVPVSLNPKRNPSISKGHLAHEKEEEQIFSSMLDKLPVGVTMQAGKHRVRKLSKGYVVIDGERLTLKDGAAKLHGRM